MGDEVSRIRQSLGLRMLKSMDPEIDGIIFTSNYVTLYVMRESGWEKAGTEGPFYIVSRIGGRSYSFVLLNKKSENYVSQLLTPNLYVVHEENFIFYRNNKLNKLFGLWHFDAKESLKCYEILQKCIEESVDNSEAINNLNMELRANLLEPLRNQVSSPTKKQGKDGLNISKLFSNPNSNPVSSGGRERVLEEFKFDNDDSKYNLSKEDIRSAVYETLECSNFFEKFFDILNKKHTLY